MCDSILKVKVHLETLEETGHEIIKASLESSKVVQEVHEELDKIASRIDLLARKISDRQSRLQEALNRCQKFQSSYDDFMTKLSGVESSLENQEALSALYETLKAQQHEVVRLQEGLDYDQSDYERLVQTARAIAETLEDEPERESLERKIGILKKRWDDAKRNVWERLERISLVEPLAKAYSDEAKALLTALGKVEKKLEAFESPSIENGHIIRQKEALDRIKEDSKMLEPAIERTEKAAGHVKREAERDQDAVQAEREEFAARFAALEAALLQMAVDLDALEEASDRFHQLVEKVEDLFERAYDLVDDPETFGRNTDKARQKLEEIQASCCSLPASYVARYKSS